MMSDKYEWSEAVRRVRNWKNEPPTGGGIAEITEALSAATESLEMLLAVLPEMLEAGYVRTADVTLDGKTLDIAPYLFSAIEQGACALDTLATHESDEG